jgi:hypothetical protein
MGTSVARGTIGENASSQIGRTNSPVLAVAVARSSQWLSEQRDECHEHKKKAQGFPPALPSEQKLFKD